MRTLLDWLLESRPGSVSEMEDRIEISHDSGEHSTLWKRSESADASGALTTLGDIYTNYDGADLFSSTFKIASVNQPKSKNGVTITFDLGDEGFCLVALIGNNG